MTSARPLAARHLAARALQVLLRALFKLAFRVEVRGIEHLARAGPRVVFVPNHASLLDGPLMLAFLPGPLVFAVTHRAAAMWWVRPFRSLVDLYPVDPADPIAAQDLVGLVRQGRPCVTFPEGRLTVTGRLMKVYPGPAYIAEKADAVFVPVRIDGAERSYFSRLGHGQVRRRPFPKIRITLGEPQRLKVAEGLTGRERHAASALALYDLMSDMVYRTTWFGPTLFEALLHARARHGRRRVILEDFTRATLTYDQLLIAALALGRRLAAATGPGERVGVLLPNANAAAVVFYALQAFARVPAMLNSTAGAAAVDAALTAAEVNVVVSSRAFVERAKLGPLVEQIGRRARVLWVEDLRREIGLAARLRAWCERWYARRLHAAFAVSRDAPAVVLFTSGSEGRPKGVVLSHGNILANCAQTAARIDYDHRDRVFNTLPLFHSLGLTTAFVLPGISGICVFLYPSPLHYRIVPEMIYASNATILFGTNSFLRGYGQAAEAYDFRGLRDVFAGAEPVHEDNRALWSRKFGIGLLEAYGATEASPAVTLNTPMYHRAGTVGRFLPGVAWRLEPFEGLEQGGRLWIKGPNVMLGYLRAEDPGVLETVPDGWYDTGDIATVDDQGYVSLLGRAKRFAKIAGEMVSLTVVEGLAAEIAPDAAHAAIALADPRKGERIVLVTTSGLDRATLQHAARAAGHSELVVPATIVPIESMPLLGSGKTDYPAVEALVDQRADPQPAG